MTWVQQSLPSDHVPVKSGRIGVLVVNLGTPDSPEPGDVKRYLKEFLSDPRVIEIPAVIWQVILRGIILNTRPKKSAEAYSKVWTDRGSPLLVITQDQAAGLQQRLGDALLVRHAMRYGKPSIPTELKALQDAGCDRILLAPLYPQYSGATTATVVDKAAEYLAETRWQAALRTLPPYHDDPAYLDALEADTLRQLRALDFVPEVLLLSFHGMPLRTLELGDPYHCHCRKTARLLAERLATADGYENMRIETTFQSRFGRAQWLEPATDDTLIAEGEKGTKRLAVSAPGFSADCVETLEELAIEGRDEFLEAGGEQFAVLSCLNASDAGMKMLESIIRRELSGWI
ncbi:ferrochelatase [Altererythrobacter sp.]|uniref:ferrochelatase n=1 Tax=Altererythrobacter sp. TaxID=1872480 RepID=UPI001B2022D3|nr:ferrochelatase [Altererythrobacter sp.]MBO6609318.1 ferrochelatase [Altererythrobacter sp.]MBO6640681.1 ferrochelatase [Altererythrobacter sp.]MBO6708621.1 ferrochelatase [Altererythrobacter sp.]